MIITLLSDFGSRDFSPGIAKGIIFNQCPEAKVVDLSHDTSPHHLIQGTYILKSSYAHFPADTIHLSLLNLFQFNKAKVLLARVKNQFIVSADNEMLSLGFEDEIEAVYQLPVTDQDNFINWLGQVAVFLKKWQADSFSLEGLPKTTYRESTQLFQPMLTGHKIKCRVIHIDPFGNVVLNLKAKAFEKMRKGRSFSILFSGDGEITHISQNYFEVEKGEALCLFNAGGFLEIAVNQGSAAQLFGLAITQEDRLVYNDIDIVFSE